MAWKYPPALVGCQGIPAVGTPQVPMAECCHNGSGQARVKLPFRQIFSIVAIIPQTTHRYRYGNFLLDARRQIGIIVHMKLKDWLSKHRISGSEFARRLNVTRAAVSRYSTEDRVPRPAILRRIHDATDGEVSAADFLFCREDGAGSPAPLQT